MIQNYERKLYLGKTITGGQKMNSWKTTISGVLAIIAGIGGVVMSVIGGATVEEIDWSTLAATIAGGASAIGAGIGLMLAKDNDK